MHVYLCRAVTKDIVQEASFLRRLPGKVRGLEQALQFRGSAATYDRSIYRTRTRPRYDAGEDVVFDQ